VARLRDKGIRVSLFAEPDASMEQLEAAVATGANRVELYTGPYGSAFNDPERALAAIETLGRTAARAKTLGLGVNAGHDLTVANLPALVKAIPFLAETSIGHGLTAEALEYGMAGAVKRFVAALGG